MNGIAIDNKLSNPSIKNSLIGIIIVIQILLLTLVALEYYKATIILVCGLLGIFLIYIFYSKPFYILPLFLLSILAGTIGSKNGNIQTSYTDILFPILLAIYFIKLFYSNSIKINKYNVIKTSFSLFLIWALFVVFVANDKFLALAYWRNYFAGFIVLLFGISYINNYKHIKVLLVMLVSWGLILAIIEFNIFISLGGGTSGLVKILINKNLMNTSWGRSNYLAAFYVLIIPITLGYLFAVNSIKKKILLTICLMIMFTAIIITLSRGGILSLGVAIIVFIYKVIKPRTFFPLIGLIFVISIILLLNPLTIVLFKGISTVDSNLSTYSRINFYEDVWKTFINNPITGVGLANLGYYSKFTVTTSAASAHNIILGTLGETGIIGACAYLFSLAYAYYLTFKNYFKERIDKIGILMWSFFSAFTGVLLHSMIEPNFEGFQFAVMFWGTFAAFLKLADLKDDQKYFLLNGSLDNK